VAAVNPATVVLVNTGAPVTMDWAAAVAAVAQMWYPGQEAGDALADVVFGDVDAGGRLPTTFPCHLEDTPAHPTYPGDEGRTRYGEGVLVGYRHYDTRTVEPRFCFGHGLSYTRFRYGDLRLATLPSTADGPRVEVVVDVTNAGERRGSEVVQVYVHDVKASVRRPDQELRQFARVALDPGETATVRLVLSSRAFAFWDVLRHDWVAEPGEFEVRVGSSSRDIHRTGRITVA
jgi:beta-glucosidase